MVSGLSQRQIQYMFVLSQMARFPSIYGYIIFHSVCIYLYTHTHRHHIFTPSSVNGHIGCFRTSSSSKGDPPSPLLRTFHDFPLSASLVATLSLQDHLHLSFFSLISLLQLHAAPQFKYLLPQGKWLSFCDPSVRSVSTYRNPACPSRLHHSAVAEALWLLSGLWLWETKTGVGVSGGDSSLAYRRSVHQTFHQADFRLPLIWQASYFPALFSGLLVCSPFFIPGCWGLPVILLSLPIPPSLSLISGTFFWSRGCGQAHRDS